MGMLSIVLLINPDIDLRAGLHLGFEAIAVFVKDQIHTALFTTCFFKKAAFFLLLGIFGRTDGHPVFFTIIRFRTTHQTRLLHTALLKAGIVPKKRKPARALELAV